MLPVLLDLKVMKIYTFGVFLVIAFFWSLFWLWRNLKRTSFKEEQIFDGVFISVIGGFIAARAVHVALHFDQFGFDILKFILINGYPGLSMIGFIAGTFLSLLIFTIGLELNIGTLKKFGKLVTLLAFFQVAISWVIFLAILLLLKLTFIEAAILGFACALSSTAVVSKFIQEKGEENSLIGSLTMGILRCV